MKMPVKVDFFRNSAIENARITNVKDNITEYMIPRSGKAENIEIKFFLPIAQVTGFWHASLAAGVKMRLDWNIDFVCGGQYNYPAFVLFNRACRCQWAVMLSNIRDDARFSARLDQENEGYKITITIASSADAGDLVLRIDSRGEALDQVLSDWRQSLDIAPQQFPQAAWDPVFCTWYAKHGAVDAAWLEPAAQRAVDMGFKTLIVDDGWCYDEYCRVNPETIANWYRTIGDYRVSELKFPRFAEHVRRVQAMGMNYMVWVAPHLIGFDSEFFARYPETVIEPLVEGYRRLNVKDVRARNLLTERLRNLMSSANLDGLKIDFIDIVRPDPANPNARETLAFTKELSDAVRSVKADALIEFRQSYTNCAMLPYATQFRAGDAPFDALKNFGRIAEIRLSLGNNIPVHADPAFWSKSDPAECVARHMIAMMGGVPMLSMDLLQLSDMEEKIIRRWMEFYSCHQTLLNHGAWRVEMSQQHIAALTVEDDQKKIILLNDSNYASAMTDVSGKEVYLANLSDNPAVWQADIVQDLYGKNTAQAAIPVGGCGVRR